MLIIILSAILFAGSFLCANLALCIIISFAALFYCAFKNSLSFSSGFLWGIIAFSLHSYGLALSLYHMAEDRHIMVIEAILLALLYMCLLTGCWFSLLTSLNRLNNAYKIIFYPFFSTVFFYFLIHYAWLPLGVFQGYPLINPLLPLTAWPTLLSLTAYSSTLALFLFFLSCTLIGYACITRSWMFRAIIMAVALGPWAYSAFIYRQTDTQKALVTIAAMGWIPKSAYHEGDFNQSAGELAQHIKAYTTKHPEKKIIILPESALFLCDLEKHPEVAQLFDAEHIGTPMHIILGALHCEPHRKHNAAYWLFDGKIMGHHEKRHALFPTEYLPSWLLTSLKKAFFTERPLITASTQKRTPFIIESQTFVPYICSEIFCARDKDHSSHDPHAMILSLCHDLWIEDAPYLDRLMVSMHILRAIEWQRPILYIAYKQAMLIMPDGQKFHLTA